MMVTPGNELKQLEDHVGHFWAGEAEVVETYFTQPGFRTREKDINALKIQCVFESGPGIGGFAKNIRRIAAMVDSLDDAVPRHRFLEEFETQFQEIAHYVGFKDLLEELMGSRISHRALLEEFYSAPWTSWSRAYYEFRAERTSELERAGISFCRGQGCADMAVLCGLNGDSLKENLARLAKKVMWDELSHGATEGKNLLQKVCRTSEDWRVSREVACEVSKIHLRARNQQYGNPLSEVRIEQILDLENDALTLDRVASMGGYRLEEFGWMKDLHR